MKAGRLTAPAVGERRGVRTAAPCHVGADSSGSVAGQEKGEHAESERTCKAALAKSGLCIGLRFNLDRRTQSNLNVERPILRYLWLPSLG
jgi:hypothetical protein